MAIIDPDGLFNGDRFRLLSNQARLYWPYFFLASNGFGRLEINYHRIVAKAFSTFDPIPQESELMKHIRDYQGAYLLFVYESGGQLWGQWDCPEKLLKKFKTSADRSSPAPPVELMNQWKQSYQYEKKTIKRIPETFQKLFGNVPEVIAEEFPLGVGVGVGEGVGDGVTKPPVLIRIRPDSASDVAQFVMQGMGLSGRENRWTIEDAIKRSMEAYDMPAMGAASQIVTMWNEYEGADIEFRAGPDKFLKSGLFLSKNRWRLRNADGNNKIEQLLATVSEPYGEPGEFSGADANRKST
jgi:hypothetical protein